MSILPITRTWLRVFDEITSSALRVSGHTESTYVFPPPCLECANPERSIWKAVKDTASEIIEDYRFTEAKALEKWE
jgi:hypothetical protein